jgi:hypothetical protein
MFLVFVFLALQFVILAEAKAEYRVFRLGITYDSVEGAETEILSTLDDQQYLMYYRIRPTEQVRLIDHWMCKGRTDEFKTYCSKGEFPSRRELAQQSNLANPADTAQGLASQTK